MTFIPKLLNVNLTGVENGWNETHLTLSCFLPTGTVWFCCWSSSATLLHTSRARGLGSAGRWQRCGRTKANAVPLGKSKTLKGRRKKKKTLGKLVSEPPAECGEKKMASLDDEYSWSPPSEAELKVIEARRERNNKISSLIGQYLLKGYKMLATTCPVCECVLLEDRMKNKYCVGCSEVDADTRKDNPAVSEEAARRAVQEIQHRQNQDKESSPILTPSSNQNIRVATTQSEPTALLSVATSTSESPPAQATKNVKSLFIHGVDLHEDVTQAVDALREKLTWASKQLNATTSIHEAQTLAALISDTCRAISALRDL